MHTEDLKDLLERHRQQLLAVMAESELERSRLQDELADEARQGTGFETMRPVHDRITDVARDYWTAHGRVALIDQLMDAIEGRRETLALDGHAAAPAFDDHTATPTAAAADGAGPWSRCAEETCPPFPPWA